MMKTAAFTVRGTVAQSARWKQAAEAEGFPSVGAWLAGAADAYLKLRAKAGLPVALSWRAGLFNVALSSGETVRVKGKMAPPFAYYEGTEARVSEGRGKRRYTLVYVPTGRTLATLGQTRDCKALASELARCGSAQTAASRTRPNRPARCSPPPACSCTGAGSLSGGWPTSPRFTASRWSGSWRKPGVTKA